VKQSHQLRDGADVRLLDAEAALHALRDTMRQASTLSAASEAKHKEEKTSLLFDHVLPMHLHVGDRFYDETGEWEVASEPYSIGAARVSTRAFGELISPPRWRIGRGSLTSGSA
jgi:hypothetical protein